MGAAEVLVTDADVVPGVRHNRIVVVARDGNMVDFVCDCGRKGRTRAQHFRNGSGYCRICAWEKNPGRPRKRDCRKFDVLTYAEDIETQLFVQHFHEGATLNAVGEFIGVSRERVRQIERDALNKIARMAEHDPKLRHLWEALEDRLANEEGDWRDE